MKKPLYLSLVIGLTFQFFYFRALPATVATHFNLEGTADGWMTREMHILLSTLLYLFMDAIFLSIPFLLRKIPSSLVSFPHKNYWLSKERKEEGIKQITQWTDLFAIVINLFLLSMFHLVYLANRSKPALLNNEIFIALLIVFLIFLVLWLVFLYRHFSPPHK